MNGNNYLIPSLHLPLYFEGSSRDILDCPGGMRKVYFDSNTTFQNVYAVFFKLTTFELICRLSPQWVLYPSLWLSMKTHFYSDIFTLNIVFRSLLFQFNSAGSGKTLDVNVNENLGFFNFFFSCSPMNKRTNFCFLTWNAGPLGCLKKSFDIKPFG